MKFRILAACLLLHVVVAQEACYRSSTAVFSKHDSCTRLPRSQLRSHAYNSASTVLQPTFDQILARGTASRKLLLRGGSGGELVPTSIVVRGGHVEPAASQQPIDGDAYKKAVLRTALVLASAMAFGLGTMVVKGRQSGLEFFAGYLVEQSLSIDNLFVFIMIFEAFKVPPAYQGRVLTWGIIGAISMRAAMILVGVAAIQKFRSVILVFAGILLVSSIKLLTEKEEEEGEVADNMIIRVSKKLVHSTDHYDGDKFFTLVNGRRMATPLLLCLVCIEISDFVFAVDSIPAVLGVSKDTFIVYTSNVFAIMGLRSLYTLMSHALTDLPYLKPSVALVLAFVSLKMVLEYWHYEIGIGVSLSVVATLLAGGAGASVWENKRRAKAAAIAKEQSTYPTVHV